MTTFNPTDKLILVDCDGVLTDGKLNIDHEGEKMFKSFHSRDVAAIRELILNGYRVLLVSADDHPSSRYFADKVGAEFVYERDKAKLGPSFIAVGDSAWDIPMLKQAKYAYMPSDSYSKNFALMGVSALDTPGGKGVMAEILWLLITKPEDFR